MASSWVSNATLSETKTQSGANWIQRILMCGGDDGAPPPPPMSSLEKKSVYDFAEEAAVF